MLATVGHYTDTIPLGGGEGGGLASTAPYGVDTEGYHFGGLNNKDYSILGSILGYPLFWASTIYIHIGLEGTPANPVHRTR